MLHQNRAQLKNTIVKFQFEYILTNLIKNFSVVKTDLTLRQRVISIVGL